MAEHVRVLVTIGSRVLVTQQNEQWAGVVVNIMHYGHGTVVEVRDDRYGDVIVCSPERVTLLDTPDLTDAVAVTDWLDA